MQIVATVTRKFLGIDFSYFIRDEGTTKIRFRPRGSRGVVTVEFRASFVRHESSLRIRQGSRPLSLLRLGFGRVRLLRVKRAEKRIGIIDAFGDGRIDAETPQMLV